MMPLMSTRCAHDAAVLDRYAGLRHIRRDSIGGVQAAADCFQTGSRACFLPWSSRTTEFLGLSDSFLFSS